MRIKSKELFLSATAFFLCLISVWAAVRGVWWMPVAKWELPKAELPDPSWEALTLSLDKKAQAFSGRVGIYLKDLKSERIWAYHAEDLFPSASLVKLPILLTVFEKIKQGELSLQTPVTLRASHRMGGSGTLKRHRPGAVFSLEDVLEHMMAQSDNTAMRMVIDLVGMDYLQQTFPKLGLTYTNIHPSGLSLTHRSVQKENYTTAQEMAGLLERTYRGEFGDEELSRNMLELLKHIKRRSRLTAGLPLGWQIAHKTGLLRRACHDAGIIFSPEGDFVLCVLTGQNPSYKRAKRFIAEVAKTTYKYYGSDSSILAHAAAEAEEGG